MLIESENNDLNKITSSGFDQKINDYVQALTVFFYYVPVIAWTFLCCIVLKGKPIVEIFFQMSEKSIVQDLKKNSKVFSPKIDPAKK